VQSNVMKLNLKTLFNISQFVNKHNVEILEELFSDLLVLCK